MLNHVSAMLSDLVSQGALVRDVAALVDRMKRPRQKLSTFTGADVRKLLAHVEGGWPMPGTSPCQVCGAESWADSAGRTSTWPQGC
jgi:hypothetical protein